MDKFMKLAKARDRVKPNELHDYRQKFDALDSFDAERPLDAEGACTSVDADNQHVRILLQAEPQVGKTGETQLWALRPSLAPSGWLAGWLFFVDNTLNLHEGHEAS